MIKILHILSSLEYGGGVQTMLYNYYTNMNKEKICFDFIVYSNTRGEYEDLFEQMGSTIIHVTPKKISLIKNIREINSVLSIGNYDIIHSHQNLSSGIASFLAKIRGVPIRISHSHSCKEKSLIQGFKNFPLRFINNVFSNYKFACEKEAGKWLFGEKWDVNEHNLIMYNAIDLNSFNNNTHLRLDFRKKLDITDDFVMLHIGRLSDEKNQMFSVYLLKEILLKKSNVVLLLVGSGKDEEKLKKIVRRENLSKHVRFLGIRKDVSNLMNAADILLLPSKNEGLGIVAIEAQACGLKVLASNKVPISTNLSELIEYIPLEVNKNIWIEKIIDFKSNRGSKLIDETKFYNYSIYIQAKKYEKWLINVVKN